MLRFKARLHMRTPLNALILPYGESKRLAIEWRDAGNLASSPHPARSVGQHDLDGGQRDECGRGGVVRAATDAFRGLAGQVAGDANHTGVDIASLFRRN